jgi:uncharacterized repeat protein (TIGR03843 family)
VTTPARLDTDDEARRALQEGELDVVGRLVAASNATLLCKIAADAGELQCVYKPVVGERPLWDFPDGTLAAREVAAHLVSEAAGWHVVPPTVLRDGPFGPGMAQLWVTDAGQPLVDVVPAGTEPRGWLHVLDAVDGDGKPVTLIHADDARLREMALFDVVINNADRKGGHVIVEESGAVLGVDHGVSFHVEDKLRTVLWGWCDTPLTGDEETTLRTLRGGLNGALGSHLEELLNSGELDAVGARIDDLLHTGAMPSPAHRLRPIPWPAF